jgi:hypothetical protein
MIKKAGGIEKWQNIFSLDYKFVFEKRSWILVLGKKPSNSLQT